MKIDLSNSEIEEIQSVRDKVYSNNRKFSGMSYEEGVRDALDWILGDVEESPADEY